MNQKIVLTGGSSGVGLALARALVKQGNNVLITGRNPDRLEATANALDGKVLTFSGDLARQDILQQLVDFVQEQWGTFSLLINNAAIQYNFRFDEKPGGEILRDAAYEIQVNFTSIVQLTALCLPLMSQPGRIVNITSGLALTPKQSAPVYCATKAALHSFSQALRWQLAGSDRFRKLSVTEALLPVVDTPMTAGRGGNKILPEQAATEILNGLEKGRDEINVGKVKLLRLLLRTVPGVAVNLLKNR